MFYRRIVFTHEQAGLIDIFENMTTIVVSGLNDDCFLIECEQPILDYIKVFQSIQEHFYPFSTYTDEVIDDNEYDIVNIPRYKGKEENGFFIFGKPDHYTSMTSIDIE